MIHGNEASEKLITNQRNVKNVITPETKSDDRAEIYRADVIRIKQLIDGLLPDDDTAQCEKIAELSCKVFSATYNEKSYGEGLYYNVMREIFAHHEAGRNGFDGWLQSNSWQAT